MAMSWLLTAIFTTSTVLGVLNGRIEAVASGAINGAVEAVKFCISIGGAMCLWCGVLELMKRSGISRGLARILRRPISLIFKEAEKKNAAEALAENVSANLLGLGNAATPAGLKAAKLLAEGHKDKMATDDLCRLVVLNTASLQLIPTSVAAVRVAAGAENAFDILPAVWISSALSVSAGLICTKMFAGRKKKC